MRCHLVPFVALVTLAACERTQAIAITTPGPPEAPERSAPLPRPTKIPAARGERLLIQQFACVYPCPTYQLEIFANGRVRWNGTLFVSAIGERVFSVEPSKARALLERWKHLDLAAVPKTYDQATKHDHATPRRALHVSESGAVTERFEAAFLWSEESLSDAEGLTRQAVEAMAAVLQDIGEQVDLPELINAAGCRGFRMGSSGTAVLGDRLAAETVAKWYELHPDSFVRIVAFDRPNALQEALKLRRALLAFGIPVASLGLRRLPALPQNERVGWGWVAAAPPRCFSDPETHSAEE